VRAAVRDRARTIFSGRCRGRPAARSHGSGFLAPLVAGMDAVVHLAGIAHVGSDIPDAIYDRVNHQATAELARAASAGGCANSCSCPRPCAGGAHVRRTAHRSRCATPDRCLWPLEAGRRSGRARSRCAVHDPASGAGLRARVRLGRHDAGDADLDGRLLAANRISFSRSPGRMPVNTISISRPGSRPGQPDHALGKIDDLDRLPHVEHVDRDVRAHRRRARGSPP
jgi:hypothetical protein